MNDKRFYELLKSWTKDLSLIACWSATPEGEKIIKTQSSELYQMIKLMWFEHRELFPNKGTYKMVRRNLIRTIALTLDKNPFDWQYVPDELCKEILHKLYQRWISARDLKADFRTFLFWKASQVGFYNHFAQKPCLVNRQLQIVFNKNEAIAFAYFMQKRQGELLFLKAIDVHEKGISMSQAKKIISKWNKNNFPKLEAHIPSLGACWLANVFLGDTDSLISDCYVSHGDIQQGYKNIVLDNNGYPLGKSTIFPAKNVFASITMKTEDFMKLNPRFNTIPFISDDISRWK